MANELMVPMNQYLAQPDVNKYLAQLLGDRKGQFVVAMTTIVNGNKTLQECDQKSLIAAGLTAVGMNLSMSPSLGHCYPVPYRNRDGSKSAQFQMGWKGFIQLALRTGQYKFINVSEVYQNQFRAWDKFNERLDADFTIEGKGKVVGYVAKFILVSGFTKMLYMTTAQLEAHGRKYSKSYDDGQWTKDFDGMAKKTVLKLLVSKFGLTSTEIEEAITKDQGVIDVDLETGEQVVRYADNPQADAPISGDPESCKDVTPSESTSEPQQEAPVTNAFDINDAFLVDKQYRVKKATTGTTKTNGKKYAKLLIENAGCVLELYDYECHAVNEGDFIIIKNMRPIQSREYNGRTYYSTSATIDMANVAPINPDDDQTPLPFDI